MERPLDALEKVGQFTFGNFVVSSFEKIPSLYVTIHVHAGLDFYLFV